MKILRVMIGMSKSDWDITGVGGIVIIDTGGSRRCRLSHIKLMLWNGNFNLTDCEIVTDVNVGSDSNYRGALLLRCNADCTTAYRLRIYGYNTTNRTYYIDKIVNGVNTILGTIRSNQPSSAYVKTRFKVDGFQLSCEEWVDGAWKLIIMAEDTSQSIQSGYCGLQGLSVNSSYYITFDNIEINKKE